MIPWLARFGLFVAVALIVMGVRGLRVTRGSSRASVEQGDGTLWGDPGMQKVGLLAIGSLLALTTVSYVGAHPAIHTITVRPAIVADAPEDPSPPEHRLEVGFGFARLRWTGERRPSMLIALVAAGLAGGAFATVLIFAGVAFVVGGPDAVALSLEAWGQVLPGYRLVALVGLVLTVVVFARWVASRRHRS